MSTFYDNECHTFPGKIGVIVNSASVNEDIFHSADRLIRKYGSDKIIIAIWPEDFMDEQDKMIDTVIDLAEDSEIRALVINHAVPGTNAAIDRLKEIRDDVFIVYCSVHEAVQEALPRADLLFRPNITEMGRAMVKQARKQKANAFVHYSFPRHMTITNWADRLEIIRETCAEEGMEFVSATALDPTAGGGLEAAQQFIIDDVPRKVARYGEDTAFFSTSCQLQTPLIRAVIDCHAIYPQPCCPSPLHGFPEALGINVDDSNKPLSAIISEASHIAAEKNMTDRLSTWPVSAAVMFTNIGAEYAIKWIRGEIRKDRIDDRFLDDCMNSCVKEIVGEGVEVELMSYEENGAVEEKYKLLSMGYLDF